MSKENAKGRFGVHGGRYIPETLMNAVIELENEYNKYKNDESFQKELNDLLKNYAGRPSRLYFAENMTKDLGGAKIYLKREDLNHTGSHKINNVLGQVLLAKRMGKKRLIAETGAGQHGVATATAAALMGMECEIFMGEEDTKRQSLNVYRMRLLGAKVHSVTVGTKSLKDAVSACMREWSRRIDDTYYVLGSVMGPHPFPTIVRDFQAVISREIKADILKYENQGLRDKISGYSTLPVLYFGSEEGLFTDEVKDIILSSLEEVLKRTPEKTRRWDVLNGDNPVSIALKHINEEKQKIVKRLFRGYEYVSVMMRQELASIGFELKEEGKHYKILYYGDERYWTAISKTPSDGRSGKNLQGYRSRFRERLYGSFGIICEGERRA